jgi:16S rRNA (cytosine967-C5)-methyltransferase
VTAPTRLPDEPVSARSLARRVLARVERDGAFANRALDAALERARGLSGVDRALATELVYGVLRRRARLDRALDRLATHGTSALEVSVRIAMRVAAYQLLFLDRVPAYAAVSDGVEACKRAGGRGAANFANAVLRRLAREGEPPLPDRSADPRAYLETAVGAPSWLAQLLLAELPVAEALAFGDAIATSAPVAMRTNTVRIDRAHLLARLAAERSDAEITASPIAPDAIVARNLPAPATTAAWAQGLFAIEDVGAQIAGALCGAAAGERILDACAGNGGKTGHLLALAGDRVNVDAVDVSAAKLDEAARAMRRLGLTGARFSAFDLTRPLADPTPRYHRILLDAPCSGLGVLRRHPEALFRRAPADLEALAGQQARLLEVVEPALLPGGILVYAVCTFDRRECDDVAAAFVARHPRFHVEAPDAASGGVAWGELVQPSGAIRTWPHRHDADAFFAVRLRAQR